MRVMNYPEITQMTDDMKFLVDSQKSGTASIRKDKVAELLGGDSNPLGRVFQATATVSNSTDIILTIPLDYTKEDNQSSEQREDGDLQPGDVFFVTIINEKEIACHPSEVKLIYEKTPTKYRFADISSGIYVGNNRYLGREGSNEVSILSPYICGSNSGTYISKAGKRTFSIFVYDGYFGSRPRFTSLTDGNVESKIYEAYNNNLMNHATRKFANITNSTYTSTTPYILTTSTTQPYWKTGSYLIVVYSRSKTDRRPSSYQMGIYIPSRGGTNGSSSVNTFWTIQSYGTQAYSFVFKPDGSLGVYCNNANYYIEGASYQLANNDWGSAA